MSELLTALAALALLAIGVLAHLWRYIQIDLDRRRRQKELDK